MTNTLTRIVNQAIARDMSARKMYPRNYRLFKVQEKKGDLLIFTTGVDKKQVIKKAATLLEVEPQTLKATQL